MPAKPYWEENSLNIQFFNAGQHLPPEFRSVILLMPDVPAEEYPECAAYMEKTQSGIPIWYFHNPIFEPRLVKATDWWALFPGVPTVLREGDSSS